MQWPELLHYTLRSVHPHNYHPHENINFNNKKTYKKKPEFRTKKNTKNRVFYLVNILWRSRRWRPKAGPLLRHSFFINSDEWQEIPQSLNAVVMSWVCDVIAWRCDIYSSPHQNPPPPNTPLLTPFPFQLRSSFYISAAKQQSRYLFVSKARAYKVLQY